MNLKEAFRYQNLLSGMSRIATGYLSQRQYVTKTVEKHMRSKANPDATDEIKDTSKDRSIPFSAEQIVEFLMNVTDEREAVTRSISLAKRNTIDIDAEISVNRIRRGVAGYLSAMAETKNFEKVIQGTDHKFNAEGNQMKYVYDIVEVSTIDFDRNKIRAIAKKLSKEADASSDNIDRAMLEIEVDYDPKFDMDDSFEDIMFRMFPDVPSEERISHIVFPG